MLVVVGGLSAELLLGCVVTEVRVRQCSDVRTSGAQPSSLPRNLATLLHSIVGVWLYYVLTVCVITTAAILRPHPRCHVQQSGNDGVLVAW